MFLSIYFHSGPDPISGCHTHAFFKRIEAMRMDIAPVPKIIGTALLDSSLHLRKESFE